VREFAVFVPNDQERLASVLTVPPGTARGLVVLLTGTGAPRSHRFQVWTRAARRLADHGLASIRFDRAGIGDSTGRLRASHMDEPPMDQVRAVTDFGIRATGVERIGVAGNCSGSRLALALAADVPQCVGAVCLLPRILEPNPVNRFVIGARRSKVGSLVRSSSLLQALAEPLRGRRGRLSPAVGAPFGRALDHARVLFVYTPEDSDSYNERSVAVLQRMIRRLTPAGRSRFELRILPNGPMSGFESVGIQQDGIDVVVGWLVDSFDRADSRAA
jgi:pimeloyl-ACP methyl ester carboxylesterase